MCEGGSQLPQGISYFLRISALGIVATPYTVIKQSDFLHQNKKFDTLARQQSRFDSSHKS